MTIHKEAWYKVALDRELQQLTEKVRRGDGSALNQLERSLLRQGLDQDTVYEQLLEIDSTLYHQHARILKWLIEDEDRAYEAEEQTEYHGSGVWEPGPYAAAEKFAEATKDPAILKWIWDPDVQSTFNADNLPEVSLDVVMATPKELLPEITFRYVYYDWSEYSDSVGNFSGNGEWHESDYEGDQTKNLQDFLTMSEGWKSFTWDVRRQGSDVNLALGRGYEENDLMEVDPDYVLEHEDYDPEEDQEWKEQRITQVRVFFDESEETLTALKQWIR